MAWRAQSRHAGRVRHGGPGSSEAELAVSTEAELAPPACVYLPTEGELADIELLAGLAREAEDAGWDGFFVWDELLPIHEHSDAVRAALGDPGTSSTRSWR
jgi:hypothetical protein